MLGLHLHPQGNTKTMPAFELLGTTLAATLTLLSVLLVVPFTDSPINHTKFYLVFLVALLSVGGFLIKSLYTKKLEMSGAKFLLPWFLFGLMHLVSSFLSNPYPVESLVGWGGLIGGLTLLTFTLSPLLSTASSRYLSYAVGIAAGALSLVAVAQLAGFGPGLLLQAISGLDVPNNLSFNLTGPALVGVEVGLVGLVVGLVALWQQKFKSKFWLIMVPVIVVGLTIQAWALLPGKPAPLSLPNWTASWSIALDSMREPRSALFGHGPASYSNLYMQYRPSWVNGTDGWALQFSQANNWPLTVVPTVGLVGLAIWVWFVVVLIKTALKADAEIKPVAMGVLVLLVILMLTPPNAVTLTLLAVFTAVLARYSKLSQHVVKLEFQSVSPDSNMLSRLLNRASLSSPRFTPFSTVLATLVLAGLVAVLYLIGRSYMSQVYAYQATLAATKNDAQGVYNHNLQSVAANQYLDVNRRRFALTNLLIAAAISNKADATQEDGNQVVTLLQQAIREARAATALDATDTQNWQVLAQIYQNMMTSAPDAREWAVQAYVKAIETSPSDPALRLALGGIFLGNNQPQQAVSFFQQAVNLKPDLANAHFNLAVSLQQIGALAEAKTSYNNVLSLLKPESEDYVNVVKQIETLDKAMAANKEATSSAKTTGSQSITSQNVLQNSQDTVNQAEGQPVNAGAANNLVPSVAPTATAPSPTAN